MTIDESINIRLFLSLFPVQIKYRYRPQPKYWKSDQKIPDHPKTLGKLIKKRRLELKLLQRDVAVQLGISSVSLSSWERGVVSPSRRFEKSILEFLQRQMPAPTRERKYFIFCHLCRISPDSDQRCLFENVCKPVAIRKLSS